VYGQDFCG